MSTEAARQPWQRPESVLVLVYVDCAQVLILKKRRPRVFWQSVTGSLEAGEAPKTAAYRELVEETGRAPEHWHPERIATRRFTIDRSWRSRYAPGVRENLEHEFRLRLPKPFDIELDRNEHSAYRWVDIDTAIDRVWSRTNKEALLALRETL